MERDTVIAVGAVAALVVTATAVHYARKRQREKRRQQIITWSLGVFSVLGSASSCVALFV